MLDDVHAVLSEHPRRYKFARTGSSARKLKRGQANLLAGRAVNRGMSTLTLSELEDAVPVTELLRFGGLPAVWAELANDRDRVEYWRTASGVEIDFIWSRGNRAVGIEVKATERWRPQDGKALQTALAEKLIQRAYGVYLGASPQRDGEIRVLPVAQFAQALANAEVL